MLNNICIASCFVNMNKDLVEFWNNLDLELEKHNLKLVLLITQQNENLKVTNYSIPYSLVEFSEWYNFNFFNEVITTPVKIKNAIINDFESHCRENRNINFHYNGAVSCRLFMENIINILQPSITLLWNMEAPQSKIFAGLMDENEIPVFSIERGLLPDTLMIDNMGLNGWSDLNRVFAVKNAIASYNSTNTYEFAKNYFKTNRIEKYSQTAMTPLQDFINKRMIGNKKIIGFLGQWDYANGFSSLYSNRTRMHSPVFESTAETLFSVAKALESYNDFVLLFKPHPHDLIDYSEFEILGNVIVEKELNMYSVLEESEVLLFNGSTIQFDALFYEKPILLTSNSQLANKGIAYEIKSKDVIPQVINDAIQKERLNEKLEMASQFVSWILDNYLIKLNPESPSKIGYREFADFIFQSSLKFIQSNVEDRISEYNELLKRIKVPN